MKFFNACQNERYKLWNYGEKKDKLTLTVTSTVKKWLKSQQKISGTTNLL